MEYSVAAKIRPGMAGDLREALESGRLAEGEVYEAEMQRALREAVVEDLLLLSAPEGRAVRPGALLRPDRGGATRWRAAQRWRPPARAPTVRLLRVTLPFGQTMI